MIKGDQMTQARLELDEYSARVLDVIKGKYGLKNRSEALKRFTIEKGVEFVEPVANEQTLRELDIIYEKHMKKHRNRKMTNTQLSKLLGM